LILVATKY